MKYDFRARSDAAKYYCDGPSLVKPEFAAACDMNNILKKYTKNGVNPFVITAGAKYGDFSELPSYRDALNFVADAQEQFDALPANLRARFSNDPALLLDFISNPNNLDEAIEIGLIVKPDQNLSSNMSQNSSPASPVVGAEGTASA